MRSIVAILILKPIYQKMTKTYLLFICLLLFVLNVSAQDKQDAQIIVDLKEQQHSDISPLIYGQFIEFLGRCIDGGIYEKDSPLSDKNGFRKDVMKHVQDLKTPLLRYPGGTVIKIYHWKDGIGPKADRPKRANLIWGGNINHEFGTAEFVSYCRQVGAEPFLVVNMSTDSPTDASDWVEYCNGTGDTYWANLRRSHGYAEPFNVKYWGIGNEEYAEPDAGRHQNVDKYIEDAWQTLKLMKLQDSTIKLTLVGNPDDLQWTRKVVSEMHPVCDFLAVHFYSIPSDTKYSTLLASVDQFQKNFDSLRVIVNGIPAQVQNFPPWYRFPARSQALKLAVDEWGIWDMKSGKGKGDYKMEYPYNWAHALAVGKFLNMFQRNADITGLATWAQTVNVLAPIMTNKKGSFRQTVYTPLQAYREYSKEKNLLLRINSPEANKSQLIDAVASTSGDGKEITVTVLNLSENEPIKTSLSFKDLANSAQLILSEKISYTAPSLSAENTFDRNVVKETRTTSNTKSQNQFEIDLAPASMNFFSFKIIGN